MSKVLKDLDTLILSLACGEGELCDRLEESKPLVEAIEITDVDKSSLSPEILENIESFKDSYLNYVNGNESQRMSNEITSELIFLHDSIKGLC